MKLVFTGGPLAGETVELEAERLSIGRSPDNDLVLAGEQISRHHAVIERDPEGHPLLRDLDSSNGTWVDGRPIAPSVVLRGGEQVRIGPNEATVEAAEPPGEEVSADGAPFKIRHPLAVIGLGLITLGIYGIVWYYTINKEMKEFGRARNHPELANSQPGMSVLAVSLGALVIVPAIVSFVGTVRRIQTVQRMVGVQELSTGLMVALLIGTALTGIVGLAIPYVQQDGLNKVWERASGAGAPGPPAALAQAPEPPPRRRGVTTFMGRTERRMKRLTIAAGSAVVVALAVAVMAVAGIFSGGGEEPKLTTRQLVRQATPSTVLIIGEIGGERVGTGSGWVLNARAGEIVTNAHVAEAAETLAVSVRGGKPRPAELLGTNTCEDLAVLRVDDTAGLRTMPRGRQRDLSEGDEVVAIGYPGTLSLDDNLVVTKGIVSVRRTKVEHYSNLIQTDAAINPGNSGGPMLDAEGRLVGVNTLTGVDVENQGYAIGVDRAESVVPALRGGESRGWTGLGLDWAVEQPAFTDAALKQKFYGPEIVAVAEGTMLGGTGITGSRREEGVSQYVVGLDGERFGKRLPPTEEEWCARNRSKQAGEATDLAISEVGKDSYSDPARIRVPFR